MCEQWPRGRSVYFRQGAIIDGDAGAASQTRVVQNAFEVGLGVEPFREHLPRLMPPGADGVGVDAEHVGSLAANIEKYERRVRADEGDRPPLQCRTADISARSVYKAVPNDGLRESRLEVLRCAA